MNNHYPQAKKKTSSFSNNQKKKPLEKNLFLIAPPHTLAALASELGFGRAEVGPDRWKTLENYYLVFI